MKKRIKIFFLLLLVVGCTNRRAEVCTNCESVGLEKGDAEIAAPICILSVPNTQIEINTSFDLTMTVVGQASSASINGQGVVLVNQEGTLNVSAGVLGPVTVTGLVSGPGGDDTCAVNYTVVGSTPPPSPPTCSLVANPAALVTGENFNATLVVLSGQTTSATIQGQGISLSGSSGTRVLTAGNVGNHFISGTVTGPGGSGTCSTNYEALPVAPICTLVVSPDPVETGDNITATLTALGVANGAQIDGAPVTLSGGVATRTLTAGAVGLADLGGSVTGPGGSNLCSTTFTIEAAPPPPSTLSSGLVSVYNFESTVAADSVGSNHGIVSGSYIHEPDNAAAIAGKSLRQFGSSNWRKTNPDLDFGSDGFSVAAWAKELSSNQTSGEEGHIVSVYSATYDPTSEAVQLKMTNDGHYSCVIQVASVVPVGFGVSVSLMGVESPLTYLDLQWHHVACTVGGDNIRLYVDGQLVASETVDPTLIETFTVTTGTLSLGKYAFSDERYFRGWIDEVGLWDRPLSASEVLDAYNTPTLPTN